MKYNFDEIIERRETDSIKWDLIKDADILPMWVADMDFKAPPEVLSALSDKISQGIFGYSILPAGFYNAIMGWWEESHQYQISKEWLLPAPGMIPALSAIIRSFLQPGENIIIQPPVYNHFFTLIENCGCNLIENKLLHLDGHYRMNFEDLELKAADPKTKMLLLCNPHNPVGRAWTWEELERLASICSKHRIMVVSDEIHADLVYHPSKHVPFISVADYYDLPAITCGSPCKTFNLSGLPVSYIICKDIEILKRIEKLLQMQETTAVNPLAAVALIAAYTYGRDWMEKLKEYLYENYIYVMDFCKRHMPGIKVCPLEATYLVWMDCSAAGRKSDEFSRLLIKEEKLWLNPGSIYGSDKGCFLRINIACPKAVLKEGLFRLERMMKKIEQKTG